MLLSHRQTVLRPGQLIVVALLCMATLLAGAIPARASVLCKHAARHGVRAKRKTCVAGSGKQLHPKRSAKKKRSPNKQAGVPGAGATPAGSTALEEQAPVGGPEQPQLPGTPPVEAPPLESAPAVKPPADKPPVEEKLPVEEKQPVEEPPVEQPPMKPVEEPPVETPPAPFRFFAPTSFWNETVPADTPLDPSSTSVMTALNKEQQAGENNGHAATINSTSWSVPIYTVPADQPTVRVTLVNHVAAALQAAWSAVPLPSNAQPAAGTDKHLVVWQPSTNRMWEFWRLEKIGGTWSASWGGAMQGVSTNRGVYGPEAWTGAAPSWGASASSLPIAGGLITLEDLKRGVINHALALAVPDPRGGVYASPAERTDGESTLASLVPEGAHLRIDPSLNLASLHLPHLTLMLAEAAQRYGIFVRDAAANLAFYAEDPTPTGTNPYAGVLGYFEGKAPSTLMASFPWSHLQLLKMELHATG